ncbi:MAG: hypothetical protein PHD54_03305 [Desulfuromonadaceae bacterium]|nr:hypothetical protein [Desulfuromonadaceae bacterium]
MRDLKDFSAGEWLRLLPLQFAFKQARNDLLLALYKKRRPNGLDLFLKESERFNNQNIALVVAFEQPWALDWLLRMSARNLTDTTVLVFDNSRRAAARTDIEQVCRKHQTPYLALPYNRTRHVNRSHGMAMTWIFYNVVRFIKPRLFAFIDHDMIPVKKTGLSERLGDQPFFGWERSAGEWSWNLWAGYCMFDFLTVSKAAMNFLYDFSRGLDTGGRNWTSLYQNYDPEQLRFADSRIVNVNDPSTGNQHSVQIIDDCWLHIGGISYNDNFRSKSEFCENLAHALDNGRSWLQVCSDIATGLKSPEDKITIRKVHSYEG